MAELRFWTVAKLAAAVCAIAAAIVVADRWRGTVHNLIHTPGPRMQTGALPLGGEIAGARESREINKVSAEYGRVKVLVDVARGKGADVANLDKMLTFSLSLARQKKYDQALTLLNRIEMDIPRPKEPVTAARADDPLPPDPEIRAVPANRKAPPAPAKRKRRRSAE
ncbi:MAG: hypothetical protein HY925_02245 [Elusimicrobia bacterium]|nr:hypothetical protein [Elusimicrobiota bacterium]